MTLRYQFDRDVATVFQLLTDADFLVKRSIDLGDLSAECEVEEEGDTTRVVQSRKVPALAIAPKRFQRTSTLAMVEEWKREGDGYRGSLEYEVAGQPVSVKVTGRLALRPRGEGCEYSVSHRVKAKIPFIGAAAEKFLTAQAREGALKELEYTDRELG